MGHLALFGVLLSFMVRAMGADLPEYTGCGATIRGIPEGIINYPNALGHWYHENQDCTWNIILSKGDRMILNFERFHLNGWSKDILLIKNGEKGTSIGTFDGHPKGQLGGKMPPIIASETNEIFLHFTSDYRWNGRGFKLTWKTIIKDDIMALVIQELNTDLQEMTNKQNNTQLQLQEMMHIHATTLSQLKELENKQDTLLNLLQETKNEQEHSKPFLQEMKHERDTTQFKPDFIIEQFVGFGCWSVLSNVTHPEGFSESHDCIVYTCTNGKWLEEGPDSDCETDNNTESPIPTDGNSMVSAESPFVPTEPSVIPTDPPVIPTDPPVIPTDPHSLKRN